MFVSLSLALEPTSLVRAATGWPYLDRGTGDENGQDERALRTCNRVVLTLARADG